MSEDVIEITSLFVEKGIKPIRESATRIRRISDSGAEVQNFEDVNCSAPGAAFFTCYEQICSTFESGSRPLSKTIKCSTHLRRSSGTIFIYLSGHGLSVRQAEKLNENKEDFSFGDEYILNMTRTQCTASNQTISAGDIIGFIKFISSVDFIKEFLSICKNGDQYERHLVLIIDACFSGNWIDTVQENKLLKRMNYGKKMSILLQTSTESEQKSNGYFFTPLFVHLNRLDEKDLEVLINDFNAMTSEQTSLLCENNQYDQNPLFYYFQTTSDNQKYVEIKSNEMTNQPIYSCHNLRFFNNTNFYQYFVEKFKYIYDIFPDVDRNLRQRPVIFQDETNRLMNSLLVQNKVSIRGMKLTRYRLDRTPLCVVLLRVKDDYRNNTNSESYDPWHILHVHFDGDRNQFPGTITCAKLLYAVSVPMKNHEIRNDFKEAADKCNNDYKNTDNHGKQYPIGCDRYIKGLTGYIHPLKQKLADWAQKNWMLPTQNEFNRNAWNTPNKWKDVDSIRLGNIAVRERSRFAITKQLISEQKENTHSLQPKFLEELISTLF